MTSESAPEQQFPDPAKLIAQLDASLSESGEINAVDREAMVRQFREALEDAPPADGTHGESLFENWAATLRLLREHQLMSDDDVSRLEHQFAAVAEKLNSEKVRLARAYMDRLGDGGSGEDEARDWLADAARGVDGTPHDAAAAASVFGLKGASRGDQRPRRRT